MNLPRRQLPFACIGPFAVSWAFFESELDLCTIMIHEDFGGREIKKVQPARHISRKLNYVEDAAGKCPLLKPYKKALIGIAVKARNELEFRHNIIHGFAGFQKSPLHINFTRWKSVFPLEMVEVEYSSKEIFEAAGKMKDIGKELSAVIALFDKATA